MKMQKISINKFKPQFNKRITTLEDQNIQKNKKSNKQNVRYSQCINMNQKKLVVQNHRKVSESGQKKINKNSKFNPINQQISFKDNILHNLLISNNQKKTFTILNNLIHEKRKIFRKSIKSNDHFKKMIKINTQEIQTKQNNFINPQNNNQRSKIMSHKSLNKNSYNKLNLISQRKKPYTQTKLKLTSRQSQILKSSFNQRIKQIKLRKYFQKDQIQINPINFFQAYGSSMIGQKHQENQDSIYFSQGIYVLCDGHGTNGKLISNFIAQTVHNSLLQCLEENKIDSIVIQEAYRRVQLELENSNFQISFSGCTCVAVLRYQNTIFCISLGDSRAILSKGYSTSEISITHKPDKPKERQRIENYGGVIRQTQTSKDKYSGPMRIWAPGKNSWGPGLALSRAFGDKASRKYGVISTPQVTQFNLTSDEQFIIIGSDGLFDYFPDQQIGTFVKKLLKDQQFSKQQIPHQLVKQARTKWPQDSDDISCIIIYI